MSKDLWQNPAYVKAADSSGRPPVYALVAAAGSGSRMGQNKQFIELAGVPVIIRSLQALEATPAIDAIILLAAASDLVPMQNLLQAFSFPKLLALARGGPTRQATVAQGLASLAGLVEFSPNSPVLVHDGARCLVQPDLILRVIAGIRRYQACGAAVPVKDTIKIADQAGRVQSTLERSSLWAVQTPQGATWQILASAYRQAQASGFLATDDLAVLEWTGQPVFLVQGDYSNIKLTTPEDIKIAQSLL